MKRIFNFYINTKIKFGCGARQFIPELLLKEKWNRVGIVIDHSLYEIPIVNNLIDNLRKSIDYLIIGKCILSEPTYEALEDLRKDFCDPSLQAVIGLGGGSTIDMSKAMAVLVHNDKPAIEYRGFDKMDKAVLPIIAVPTTAGTGSEITPNASFIDTHEKKKLGINGEAVRPSYAILDPELTLSCPKNPTISSGIDSIVHATEAYVAKGTNPLAQFFAAEGFRKVVHSLPVLVNNLDDISHRQEVMYGAFLSGIALMHSGTGPAAAMSYPLGVHFNVPHGMGGGIFLPFVVEHNISKGYNGYLGLLNKNYEDELNKEQDFIKKLWETWDLLEIPKNLSFCGLKKADIVFFVKETLELKNALDQNPLSFASKEIKNLLLKLL